MLQIKAKTLKMTEKGYCCDEGGWFW